MIRLVLALIPLALLVSFPLTAVIRTISRRAGAMDSAGVPGQVKGERRAVPNTGGIAITAAFVLPLAGIVWFLNGAVLDPHDWNLVPADLAEHVPGITARANDAWLLLGGVLVLHVLGLIDDRLPLGPYLKLGVMMVVACVVMWKTDTRLLTMLDARVGGAWLSLVVTVAWVVVVTNAMNFMDNMDGLSAGTACVAAACFLATALLQGQWFVGACLALLVGATLGFLVFNAPPASIFMGDGGSLVIGFLLGFLTVRTTYIAPAAAGVVPNAWYAVFMPLCVLAVPIYDFVSVTCIRLAQGRSPFVGDLQHLSHRLVRRGMSKRAAVGVIWGFTLVTGVSGVVLGSLNGWQALLVAGQVVTMLLVVAAFEYASAKHEPAPREKP